MVCTIGAEAIVSRCGAAGRVGGARETTSSGARGLLGRRLVEMILELSGTSRGAMVGSAVQCALADSLQSGGEKGDEAEGN